MGRRIRVVDEIDGEIGQCCILQPPGGAVGVTEGVVGRPQQFCIFRIGTIEQLIDHGDRLGTFPLRSEPSGFAEARKPLLLQARRVGRVDRRGLLKRRHRSSMVAGGEQHAAPGRRSENLHRRRPGRQLVVILARLGCVARGRQQVADKLTGAVVAKTLWMSCRERQHLTASFAEPWPVPGVQQGGFGGRSRSQKGLIGFHQIRQLADGVGVDFGEFGQGITAATASKQARVNQWAAL